MNDLNRLLDDAAASDGGQRLNPHALLASGRRRVRNRRAAVAGCVTAAVVAAAALVAWLPGGNDRADVVGDPSERSAIYEEVRIPVEEVERRCSIVLNAANPNAPQRYVTGRAADGTAVPGSEVDHFIETREGWTAYLMPVGEEWPAGEPFYDQATELSPGQGGGAGSEDVRWILETACLIPQPDQVDAVPQAQGERLPRDATAAEVVDLCAARTGYDLRGWDPLLVGSQGSTDVAIMMSDNGYVAVCKLFDHGWSGDLQIEPEPYLDSDGQPIHADPEELILVDAIGGSGGRVHFSEARVLPGLPDDHTVTFSVDGEVIAETTTHRGAFLIAFNAPGKAKVVGRLTDPDGTVVWEGVVS